jgi:hypothetical protein
MDKQLISFLLHRPSSWFACAQVAWAKLRCTPQVTVWREGLRIQTGTGNGEGLFCAVAGTAYEAEMKWFFQQLQLCPWARSSPRSMNGTQLAAPLTLMDPPDLHPFPSGVPRTWAHGWRKCYGK